MRTDALIAYINEGGFYKSVVEDGSDLVIAVDQEGIIRYANPSVVKTLEYTPDEILDTAFIALIHPEDQKQFHKDLKKALGRKFTNNIEFRFRIKSGDFRHFEFNSINLKHKADIPGLILDCRDITQRKKDAQELIEAQKAKEQFLAKMSHEIRTPINGIAGMVNLLMSSRLSEDQEKFLNAIKSSTDNLKVIINDILDLSVIESGNLAFEKVGFNPTHQIKSVLETFRFQANEKGLSLDFKVMHRADKVLIGDPVRFNQILINLVSNAIKFTNSGDIFVKADAENIEDNTLYLQTSVTDTGVGIPKEKLERIFEAFRQADESVTRKYGGTGLGLSICKQLVEMQGGRIDVRSKPNLGTEFRFVIPYPIGKQEDIAEELQEETVGMEESLHGIRVLLVEDNDINRLYARNLLQRLECDIDEAENGLIALEKIKNNDYDLVLMDIQMPVMDGYEATRSIREGLDEPKSKIPIIALTASALKGEEKKCFDAGMNNYLSKPFQPEELFSIIRKYVDSEDRKSAVSHDSESPESAFKGKITDLSYLASVSNNDNQFMREMIKVFLKTVPDTIASMKANLGKDWDTLSQVAHKIKPSVTLMGIESLKKTVKEIEVNARERKELDSLPEKVDLFILTATQACNELETVLNTELRES